MTFEIRELDAWGNEIEGYDINTSYLMGNMETRCNCKNDKKSVYPLLKIKTWNHIQKE